MTRIIVAHRPETILSADRVIVLDRGKIVPGEEMLVDGTELPLSALSGTPNGTAREHKVRATKTS